MKHIILALIEHKTLTKLHKNRQPLPKVSRAKLMFLNYFDKPHELLHCSNCQLPVKTNHPFSPTRSLLRQYWECEKCYLSSPFLNHRFKNTHLLPRNSCTTMTGVGVIHHSLEALFQTPSHDAPSGVICPPISSIRMELPDLLDALVYTVLHKEQSMNLYYSKLYSTGLLAQSPHKTETIFICQILTC